MVGGRRPLSATALERLGALENISGIAASLPLGVSVARQSVLPFGSPNKDTPIEVQYEVN